LYYVGEFFAFCEGRFSISRELCQKVFDANDANDDKTIDRNEFHKIFARLDKVTHDVEYEIGK
jgi:hypothetical protein